MFYCPKCEREFKTESRMHNHIPKCKGKCSCGKPLINRSNFCSRACQNEFFKNNPEFRKQMTQVANEASRRLGAEGKHWTQQDNEQTRTHFEKWYTAGHERTRELVAKGEFWTQSDKEKVAVAMVKIHTKEAHEKLSKTLKGRTFSKKHRESISKVRIERGTAKGSNNPMYGKHPITTRGFKSGMREDLGHFVRSSWEANFARVLKYKGITYDFEPEVFELIGDGGEQLTYRPDFKVGDKYYEVKGFWYDDAKYKFNLFCQQYSHIDIEVIDKEKYEQLKSEYQDKIKEWE